MVEIWRISCAIICLLERYGGKQLGKSQLLKRTNIRLTTILILTTTTVKRRRRPPGKRVIQSIDVSPIKGAAKRRARVLIFNSGIIYLSSLQELRAIFLILFHVFIIIWNHIFLACFLKMGP